MCFNLAEHDQFGFNISLNYRKQNQYGTRLGGCCSLLLFIIFWSMTLTLCFKLIFNPNYSNFTYTEYMTVDSDISYETGGTSSLAILVSQLFKEDERIDLKRYVGLYFSTRNSVTKEESFISPALCTEVLDHVPQSFWDTYSYDSSIDLDKLYCPDLHSYTLSVT